MSYDHPLDLPPAARRKVLMKIEELKHRDSSLNVNIRSEGEYYGKVLVETSSGQKPDKVVPKTAEAICDYLDDIVG
jgi:hypothetical protein